MIQERFSNLSILRETYQTILTVKKLKKNLQVLTIGKYRYPILMY